MGKVGSSPQSKGGLARAAKLGAERREEIATRAAEARWGVFRDGARPPGSGSVVRASVSVALSRAVAEELVQAAKTEGLSLSRLVSRAVAEWLVRRAAGKKGD